MGRYDLTMKRLTSEFPEDYVRLVLRTDRFEVEPLEVEEVDRALPSLAREVDFVARVRVEGEEAILVLESQTRWEGDVPERLFHYTRRLRARAGRGGGRPSAPSPSRLGFLVSAPSRSRFGFRTRGCSGFV